MKTRATTPGAGPSAGVTLLECLVYVSVVTVVLGIGMATFWRAWDANKAIRRDAEDIVRALHAGEQWRADLRAATGPVRPEDSEGAQRLRIPSAQGEIVYTLTNGELRRQARPGARETVVLTKVKSCRMQPDPRPHVTAWRWELELQTARRKARLRPLFTFEAVPGHSISP